MSKSQISIRPICLILKLALYKCHIIIIIIIKSWLFVFIPQCLHNASSCLAYLQGACAATDKGESILCKKRPITMLCIMQKYFKKLFQRKWNSQHIYSPMIGYSYHTTALPFPIHLFHLWSCSTLSCSWTADPSCYVPTWLSRGK